MIQQLKNWAKKIQLDITALYLSYQRKDVPRIAKLAAVAAFGYALSPIDLIPDFIPLIGYLDDLVMLPLLILLAVKLIPSEILNECRMQAKGIWQNGKPKKWKYAIPILLVWIILATVIIKAIWF